ncbi:MAG TPA: hypothetical protein VJJ21_00070 [Candidatus Nanoarchaeia archaeon]|nr:hypothetical protein [Candidatus Nanoarchaeia archaeon]
MILLTPEFGPDAEAGAAAESNIAAGAAADLIRNFVVLRVLEKELHLQARLIETAEF